MTNPNDPAFGHAAMEMALSALQAGRTPQEIHYPGLTKREEFAKAAMQGMMTNSPVDMMRWADVGGKYKNVGEWVAGNAVDMADALIAELNREEKK